MTQRPRDAPRPQNVAAELLATKCDLCRTYERGPACVQVCPTSAITRVDPQRDWAEVAALLGRGGAPKKSTTAAPATTPAWPLVMGALVGAAAVGLVGVVMRARGHWTPGRGVGYFAGWGAGAAMAVLLTYALPKRMVKTWMRFGGRKNLDEGPARRATKDRVVKSITRPHYLLHLVIGIAAVALAIVHAPHTQIFAATRGSALLLALYAACGSGALMALFYGVLPQILSRIERSPLLPEDFTNERAQLSAQLYKSLSGRDDLVKAVASRVLLPYARNPFGAFVLAFSGRDLRSEQKRLRSRIDSALEGRGRDRLSGLEELVRIAVELRAQPAQRYLTMALRIFLPIHIVAFAVACVLLVLHVLVVKGR